MAPHSLIGFGAVKFEPYPLKKEEEYMNSNQIKHFEKILHGWQSELMKTSEQTMQHIQSESAHFADPNDLASQEEEFTLELRARERERKLLDKIHEALERLSAGDYGYCDACGIEIGVRRLEARPTANLCIDCKTVDEIKEKQTGI